MLFKKKYAVIFALASTITIGVAALPSANNQYKNLRVLPKNISSKDLSKIMIDDFEDGLGVSCTFCHIAGKDSLLLDFANDAKPEKQIARRMMKMTMGNGQPRPGDVETK
jgi:hypothetical protein